MEAEFDTLCTTCRFSTIMKDRHRNQIIYCSDVWRVIPMQIETCTSYKAKNIPTRSDMEEIAWLIDPKKRNIGFVAPGTQMHKDLLKD